MNKSRLIFLIAFSFVCVMLFAVPTIGTFCSILMGIVPFLIAMFGFKDKTAASKTLQPYIILGAVAIVRLFFDFLFYIIITLGGSVDAQMAYIIIQVLLLIILFALEIVSRVHRSFICLFGMIFSFSCLVGFMEEREAAWSLLSISYLSCSPSYKRKSITSKWFYRILWCG